MKIIRILTFVAITCFAVSVTAQLQQLDAGGSPYSLFGIGDIVNYSSNRTYGMGISGTSLFGEYVNTSNPAALAKLRFTDLTLAMNYGFFKSENSTTSNDLSNGNVLGFNIGIPISQGNGWVMSLGFNPVSIVNTQIGIKGTVGEQNYEQTFSAKGGLSRINIGMSYTILQRLTLGAEYNYGFGEIKSQNYIDFRSASFVNTNIRKEANFDRSYMKGGAILEVGKLIRSIPLRDFTIGFMYQSGFDLSSSVEGIYNSSLSIDTINLGKGIISVPSQMSFGLTNIFARKYVVSGDFMLQDWSGSREQSSLNVELSNSYRAGLGIEILPSQDAISLFERLAYRLGGFYEKNYYTVAGNDINTWGIRAGLNIPISQYNSIDIGINYSQRGKTDNGLVKDQLLNFTASVNFGELWFIRPREEDQ